MGLIKNFYSTAEAADYLGIVSDDPRRQVQRWCAAGRFPGAVKNGRDWLIPARSVETFTRRPVGRPPRPAGGG